MGNSKRNLAHEEVSKLCAELDAPNPPSANGNDNTIESMDGESARAIEEYECVKAQLDNQNLKLQHLTERRTTQQALSNPNASSIDRMFSVDIAGLYVYKGSRMCCLDASSRPCTSGTVQSDARCKHELCARATSTGISWKELDTIKWYDMRIRYEKTPRMKGALVKQRDVELVRIKQSEDEEQAKSARRFNKRENNVPIERLASATRDDLDDQAGPQDLDKVVFESRMSMMQIHKYNAFVGARQRGMANIAKCSDVVSMALLQKATRGSNSGGLEEQLRKAQIRSETLKNEVDWYTMKIAEAARASKIVAEWHRCDLEFDLDLDGIDPNAKELCDLVRGLLTDLGMPVETIDNIQHAQSALAHVMRQPVNTKSLKFQQTLDHIKKVVYKFRARSDKIRASSPNAASYTPMPASSGDLRNRIIDISVEQGRSAAFGNEVYSELVQIEDAAVIEIHEGYQTLLASPVELAIFLEKIKTTATAKSSVPEITEKVLDIMISTRYDMSKGYAILKNLDQLSDQVLVANISGLVFVRAEKKAEWLMDAFRAIEAMFESVSIRPLHTRITHALKRVQTSVQTRIKASREVAVVPKRLQETILTSGSIVVSVSQAQTLGHTASHVVEATSADMAIGKDKLMTAHEQSIVDTVELYTAETASRYTSYLSQHRYCPGCATLRIAQLLAALLTKSPQRMGKTVAALTAGHSGAAGDDAAFGTPTESSGPETWTHTVSCGVKYITEMVHALTSDFGLGFALERRASLFGKTIVIVVERVVFDTDVDISLSLAKLSISEVKAAQSWTFGSIVKKFSEDGRFACAALHNNPCSRHTSGLRPDESRIPQPSAYNAAAPPPSKALRLEAEGINPENALALANEDEKSDGVTSATLTTSVVPGPARRRLLPRGERHQSQYDALEAAAKVAGMGTNLAKKMSDFCVLQQKAYERAGLVLSPEAIFCMKQIKRVAYMEPGTQGQDHHDCPCPPCAARRTKFVNGTSKFIEDFSDTFNNEFEVTIEGRAVADDELLGYTGATVERIRSIASGEATLEYVCWVAHKVSEEADRAEATGQKWSLPVRRFEEFFTYYAPIPLELELALDYAKGNVWPNPICREHYPSEQSSIIDDILVIMGRIGAKQLTFPNGTDDWRFTPSMVPKPLNLRKDRPDCVGKADSSAETTSEALTLGEKQLSSGGEPQQSEMEMGTERLRLDKKKRQREATEAQIETIRRTDETTTTPSPSLIEPSIQRRFNAYNASAWPIINYMSTLAEDDFNPEEDFRLAIAVRVQTQHLDCVRMIQLVAESKGWDATAVQMKEHLEHWGFKEDEEGHYPDFWGGATPLSGDEDEGGNDGHEQGPRPAGTPDQDA